MLDTCNNGEVSWSAVRRSRNHAPDATYWYLQATLERQALA